MSRGFAVCVAVGLLGCASTAPARVPDPALSARRFAAALREDKPDAAYALLDPELRATLDRARFGRLWRENRAELVELGTQLERAGTTTPARAELELEDGERVVLLLEQGHWHVAGGVLDAQALDTPLDAVAELRRALLRQSMPSLLRVLARERRAAWVAAFEKTVQQSADPLDLRVEVHGNDAVVHLSGGGQVLLRKEAGRWHVWDVR